MSQFVTLLKVLDHMGRTIKTRPAPEIVDPPVDGQSVTESLTQPARKKRRVNIKSSKLAKKTFYAAPLKANSRGPASTKSPKTIPFVGMVWKSWLRAYDVENMMELREDYVWWDKFQDQIRPGDISEDDLAYLAELDDDSASDDDVDHNNQ
jgi:hypothetical protein